MLTMVFWGGTVISGRMLAGEVSPFSVSFLRFAIATTILFIVLYRRNRGIPPLPRYLLWPVLCLGVTGVFIYNALFFWGLHSVSASRASVIIANNPILIAVLAAIFLKEPMGWTKIIGVLISVCGAVIAISGGDLVALMGGGLGRGDLMIFGCVLSWVTFSLVGKSVVNHIPPLTTISYTSLVGALLLLCPALMEGMVGSIGNYSLLDWTNIGFLGIFGTAIGFVWYYEAIDRIGASRSGLFINFVPISAILMAYFLLGEAISPSLIIGIILVLSGVFITNNGLTYLPRIVHRTDCP
jgi:drug/metabolite transporter (DMT)-like permease